MLVGPYLLLGVVLMRPGDRKVRNRPQSLTKFNVGTTGWSVLDGLTINAFNASSRWLKFTSQTLVFIPGNLGAA